MPILLTVRQVREAIQGAAGGFEPAQGPGLPSSAGLGRLFHEVFATLVGSDPRHNLRGLLADAERDPESRRQALVAHAYQHLIGPKLGRDQALLHHQAAQVLDFWKAVGELCAWLAELGGREAVLAPETPLTWEVRQPGWTDSVRLGGVADAVVRDPRRSRWCVVELKLGRTSPEADLAQVCLYHRMLQEAGAGGPSPDGTALALVSFEPDRRERLIASAELHEAQERLIDLIGRLAGVVAGPTLADREPAPTSATPDHFERGRQLARALEEYGARVTLDGPPIVGPTFLRFPVVLGTGVKLDVVRRCANEVRVRLGLDAPPRIGIERGRIAIDLQRPDRQFPAFAAIRPLLPPADPVLGSGRAVVGIDLEGKVHLADFQQPEHAHLLVAGATGSGKTEWLRMALASLLAANTPATLRLVAIDPKRNAFNGLRDSPFLLVPILYPDERPAWEVLAHLADIMEGRYRTMAEAGADTLDQWTRRTGRIEPRIVCVCDEYADLLHRDREERRAVEQQLFRLGAKARAAGIHLLLATQQPSREVVRGALDANIPARMALRVEKAIDSRMILGCAGAEDLLGRGDLLFKDVGEPVRLQAPRIAAQELEVLAHPPRSGSGPVGDPS